MPVTFSVLFATTLTLAEEEDFYLLRADLVGFFFLVEKMNLENLNFLTSIFLTACGAIVLVLHSRVDITENGIDKRTV